MRHRNVASLLLASAVAAPAASAQIPEAVRLAASSVRAVMDLPAYQSEMQGSVVMADLSVLGSPALESAGAERLGLPLTRRENALQCTPDHLGKMRRCSLKDTDFLVSVESLDITGDEATVAIEVMGEAASERQPVFRNGWYVKFRRVRGEWSVVSLTAAYQT